MFKNDPTNSEKIRMLENYVKSLEIRVARLTAVVQSAHSLEPRIKEIVDEKVTKSGFATKDDLGLLERRLRRSKKR